MLFVVKLGASRCNIITVVRNCYLSKEVKGRHSLAHNYDEHDYKENHHQRSMRTILCC